MIRLLPYIYVTIQTALVTGMISRWLHIRHVRRLLNNFQDVLKETIGIMSDNPRYTVKVRQMNNLQISKDINKRPYDWQVDEQFDKIINKNFPQE